MLELAERMSRLGTDSAFEVLARAKALEAKGRSIIHLGIGQPDFPPPGHVIEAAYKAMRDGHNGYTPTSGIAPLREAVAADLLRRHKIDVSPEQVQVTPGGKVVILFATLMFGEPGAEILYPNPGFFTYESAIAFTGATPVPYPLLEKNGFAFDAEDVLARITPKTRLLILNSPANPTGGVTPRSQTDKLAKGLEKFPKLAVLSDEIYSRILYDGNEHVCMLGYEHLRDRVILLDGWSKTYAMTGWRVGYGVWPKALISKAEGLAINCHSCVNASAQYGGIAALEGPQDDVNKMVAEFDRRRRAIVAGINAIPGLSCIAPGGAFYAFPNIKGIGLSSREMEAKLLNEAGIAAVSGASFGSYGEGYLRFSYANSMENIEEALRRLAFCLAGPGQRGKSATA
jgi:aspartate/methionine/tyrosine aminotransferase